MTAPRRPHHGFHCSATIIAVAVAALGIWKGAFVAGDTDAFGYVSEADLIAHGALRIEQQFVRTLPWPFAEWSFSPAGYRPAPERGFIVPTYSAGVPLVMAGFQRLAGPNAVFYVVPLFGALAVWTTALIGRSVHSRTAGILAMALLATSPAFVVELLAPASDVAATAWWSIVLACTLRRGSGAALGAGLAASAAIVTRPNLVPLAALVGVFFAWRAARVRGDRRGNLQLLLYIIGTVPGCVAVAVINQHLYGSPLRSGYEPLTALYAWSHVGPNLDRYPRWLMQTETPFVLLALAAPVFVRRGTKNAMRRLQAGDVALLLTFACGVAGCYLFYRPFGRDDWTYLRFLLPAYPPVLVLAVAVVLHASRRLVTSPAVARAIAVIVCLGVMGWLARKTVDAGALNAREVERRYLDVGRYVETMLPSNSLCIARLHAGSIRYYSGRLTMYFDWLEPRWLDDAVRELAARGYRPFIVVEEGEEAGFRERFGPQNVLGRLDWPPAAARTEPVRVRIYDPADRERFLRGERVQTNTIERWRRFK